MSEPLHIGVPEAVGLLEAGKATLADTRDARLFDNLHAASAISVPLAAIEAGHGDAVIAKFPRDGLIILYCA
ncbi:MAG TPA: rhodanese-like domain-containing protein [Gemmatimonadales bacterium]|nr:rhodanese-like domain-containing protein [Gemmatimonadales bacterium]